MNQQDSDQWRELARIWKAGDAAVTAADIEALHARQHLRLRVARAGELACSVLGIVAATWLGLASRFTWVGILTAAFSVASVFLVLRTRRMPVPQGCDELLESLQGSLSYLDWLAGQLRYGRILGFMAMFAVVMAASTQLMRSAGATSSALIATAAAGMAIGAALAWNMTLAWKVWRCRARLQAFRLKLVSEISA
jgi:hypothetical protein